MNLSNYDEVHHCVGTGLNKQSFEVTRSNEGGWGSRCKVFFLFVF